MSTKLRELLGNRIRHTVTLDAGESVAVTLDSSDEGGTTIQISVAFEDVAMAHGSCFDAADVQNVDADAFPLFGEDGLIPLGAARTVAIAFPGPLRTVFLTASPSNTGTVRAVILQ